MILIVRRTELIKIDEYEQILINNVFVSKKTRDNARYDKIIGRSLSDAIHAKWSGYQVTITTQLS